MKVIIDGIETDEVLLINQLDASKNGVYKINRIREERMKVIIELNNYTSIENVDSCPAEVKISMTNDENVKGWTIVNIEDLKLALRKMTAK